MTDQSKENGVAAQSPPPIADAPRVASLASGSRDAWSGTRTMVALVGAAVLLLAMKAAAGVVAPIVLALVVAVGIAPVIGWLIRKGLRANVAFAVTVTVTVIVEIVVILVLSASLGSFALSLPGYQDEFQHLWDSVVAALAAADIDLTALLTFENVNFMTLVHVGMSLIASLTSLFSTLLLVTFTAAFMLLEATSISDKMEVAGMSEATRGSIQRLASQ